MTICTICNSHGHVASSCKKRQTEGAHRVGRVDWDTFDKRGAPPAVIEHPANKFQPDWDVLRAELLKIQAEYDHTKNWEFGE